MITLKKAIAGMDENMLTYINTSKDPALYNISLALKAICQHLDQQEYDLRQVKSKLDRL